jgi:hypothetical protein
MSKFPANIWVKETHVSGEFIWKFLCVVHDKEALGLIERRFEGIELKVDPPQDEKP